MNNKKETNKETEYNNTLLNKNGSDLLWKEDLLVLQNEYDISIKLFMKEYNDIPVVKKKVKLKLKRRKNKYII